MNKSEPQPQVGKQIWYRNLGLILVLLSGVLFFAMVSVPWWSAGNSQKVFWGGALFVGVQAAWWVGVALLGPSTANKIKTWFAKSKKTSKVD